MAHKREYRFRMHSLMDLRRDNHLVVTSGDYNGDGGLDVVIAIDNAVKGPRGGSWNSKRKQLAWHSLGGDIQHGKSSGH